MATTTANLSLTLPTPNVDTGWGSTLNTDFTLIDNLFTAAGTGTSVGLNVGTGKTLGIGGTLLLGSGDGTGTTTGPTIRGAARTGTNVAGATLVIDAANGTGSGGSGLFIFRTAPPGTGGGGANPNTMQNSVVINNNGSVSVADAFEAGGYISAAEYSAAAGAGGRINFNATTGAGTSTPIALVKGLLTNGSASFAGDLGFYTSVGATLYERMSITGSGGVSFGASGTAYGSSGQVLQSNGNSPPTWVTPTAPTTANVLAATAGASAGDVGTYAFLRFNTLTNAVAGTTHAGSGLRYSNANGSSTGGTPSGTWRLMGDAGTLSQQASTSLFLRIA